MRRMTAFQMCVGALLVTAGSAWAQTAPADQTTATRQTAAFAQGRTAAGVEIEPPAGYVIGAGDVLGIKFWQQTELSGDVVVRPDGKISIPLLNDVQASGQTPQQLSDYWDALADGDVGIAADAAKVLSGAPRSAMTLFAERLTAGEARDVKDLPGLIAELCGEDAKANLHAAARLKSFGRQASPSLFTALAARPSHAARQRLEDVLQAIGEFPVPPDALQRTRAIQWTADELQCPTAAAPFSPVSSSRAKRASEKPSMSG